LASVSRIFSSVASGLILTFHSTAPWQNSQSFPTARDSHADSDIDVIHYYNNVLLLPVFCGYAMPVNRSPETSLRHQLISVTGKFGLTPASSVRTMPGVAGT
jgi:hypothetical protein